MFISIQITRDEESFLCILGVVGKTKNCHEFSVGFFILQEDLKKKSKV